jgi:hypothetical protein
VTALQTLPADLRTASTELKAELADALAMSARHLTRLAVVWCELDDDLDDEGSSTHGIDPLAAVKVANPHDAADLIVKAIEGSPDPKMLARRLLPELDRVARAKPRPLVYEP